MRFEVVDLADLLGQWQWGRTLVAVVLLGGVMLARVPATNLIVHQYEDRITTMIRPLANRVDHVGAFDPPRLVRTARPITASCHQVTDGQAP